MIRQIFLVAMAIIAFSSSSPAEQSARALRLMTDDNVSISAVFYAAKTQDEFAPAVLLLHSLGQSRDEWPGLPAMLQRNGISCLVIDLRGHGQSTRRLTDKGPELVNYQTFTERDYADMLLDVNAAVNWLTEQTDIDKHRMAIIGSGFGASLALQYASFNADIRALLLFSPGNYQGISIDKAVEKIGPIALRLYVSRYDNSSYNTAKRLLATRKEMGYSADTKSLVVCSGGLQGGEMLRGVDQLPQLMLEWLQQVLLGVSPPVTKASVKPASATPPKK